jgi:UDP-galactopyranose mutase
MIDYDYLIVGSGLFGSVFAREMTDNGSRCLVIDRRNHMGGNIYCENHDGINVHLYGPHIFHTDDDKIWEYVNRHVKFNHFIYSPIANYKGEVFNLPFNMNTFNKLWGVIKPVEAVEIIDDQIKKSGITNPQNLEEQAISLVGIDIYEKLIKGYTEKQWGKKATELPTFIIKRLPVRFTYDNNYFNDKYQGIPIGGYNKLIDSLLDNIEVKTGVNFFDNLNYWKRIAKKIVYTGSIDQYFDYKFGNLEYRTLKFESERLEINNYQGNAGVNYTDFQTPFTRIVEHKHFEFGKQSHTVITKEYSSIWKPGSEPYYPINDQKNSDLFKKYSEQAKLEKNVIFGGRLAEYRYYDMHQIIASALMKSRQEINNKVDKV